MLTIGKLAAAAGVRSDTLRYYEREGLIEPAGKSPAGYRLYDQDSARRLRFIKQAQHCGFTLAEIRELLVLRGRDAARCGDVRKRAIEKKRQLEGKIRSMRAMCKALDRLIAGCVDGNTARRGMRDPRRLRATRDNRADALTIGPEYQAHRDGHGGRSAVDAVLRNTSACCLARRARLDRLRCQARLRAHPR